jgi:energy-coupling factor transport system permease protein
MIHSLVWVMWLLTALVFILSTRNPIYLSLILIGLFILGHHLARKKRINSWFMPNFRFLLTMILLSTLINGFFAHVGHTVLFTIPQGWPLVGGNITLESLAYGAINGLVIGALYILFNILNLALSIKQLTRLIPRAFHPIAMMVTIALTFFPSIQRRAREIKEAQMIRGNPMKKISDWVPILIPLLVTSLENAFLLAESMTARGFHKQVDLRTPRNLISLLLGAFVVFSGWILHLYRYPLYISVSLYFIGALLIIMTLILIGKHSKITRYHHEVWIPADIFMAITNAISLFIFAYLVWTDHLFTLSYSPYPHLIIPAFQLPGLLFSLLPLVPMLRSRHD